LNKRRVEIRVEESLEIGSLLPFAISHGKIVKVLEDIGIKILNLGHLGELSSLS
jgi:hypothetical protein